MSKRASQVLSTAMAVVLVCGSSAPAFASSHREAPGTANMPKTDGTDFYMFRSYEPGRDGFVTFIANYVPVQNPGDGPNFYTMDSDAVYDIKIDSDGDAKEDLTYRFKFFNDLANGGKGLTVNVGGKDIPVALRNLGPVRNVNDPRLNVKESYTVTQITGDSSSGAKASVTREDGGTRFTKPMDNIGSKTFPSYPGYARTQYVYPIKVPNCATEGRVFVGQREEAFAINLGPTFDLIDYIPIEGDSVPGANDGKGFPGGITQSAAHQSLIGHKNVTSIALELPIACVTGAGNGVIGAWTTASLPQARVLNPNASYGNTASNSGAYVQVSRLSAPLVNELVIGLSQKDTFNSASPSGDAALADYVTNPTFPAIVDKLFRDAVNKTLGTNISNLAPSNIPRTDLVATYLTGFPGVNQQKTVTPSEMMRLNTGVAPTPRNKQSHYGVIQNDLAGFPNGRRPGDDVTDITLRVAMGRLCYPIPVAGKETDLGYCKPKDAPIGNQQLTDGAPLSAMYMLGQFPYLNDPLAGGPVTNPGDPANPPQ